LNVKESPSRPDEDLVSKLYVERAGQQTTLGRTLDLPQRVRSLRRQNDITLEVLAKRASLARSTLSKIENGQMSPTFEVLLKLSAGFGIELVELLKSDSAPVPAGRFAVTQKSDGSEISYPNYVLTPHAATLKTKRMLPFVARMVAKSPSEFKKWDRHETEDFMFVLRGRMIFYSEIYEPVTLDPGDSVYFDGRMGHACISGGAEVCETVYVCTQI
jgi:transcriptional regulator with XRE-family HTH domain